MSAFASLTLESPAHTATLPDTSGTSSPSPSALSAITFNVFLMTVIFASAPSSASLISISSLSVSDPTCATTTRSRSLTSSRTLFTCAICLNLLILTAVPLAVRKALFAACVAISCVCKPGERVPCEPSRRPRGRPRSTPGRGWCLVITPSRLQFRDFTRSEPDDQIITRARQG